MDTTYWGWWLKCKKRFKETGVCLTEYDCCDSLIDTLKHNNEII